MYEGDCTSDLCLYYHNYTTPHEFVSKKPTHYGVKKKLNKPGSNDREHASSGSESEILVGYSLSFNYIKNVIPDLMC